MLTFEQIKELIELIDERELGGLEIERSGFRLKIEGQSATPVVAAPLPMTAQPAQAAAVGTPQVAQAATPVEQAEEPSEPESDLPADAHIVTSPIVGTFYAASSPDAAAYVKVGDRVEPGQVLCIVEAMKLMNEIESDVSGVVLAIYPKNAQAVEFGEQLFAVAPG